jgi:L-ascorbate metabolism protein UlaG (beta-lactamase superfamily)
MKITKHEHAFLEISKDEGTVLIDPGMYSTTLPELGPISALILTHIHDDHSFLPHIQAIRALNPNLKIFGPAEVATKLDGVEVTTCYHGDSYRIAGFKLDFYGDLHQEIHRSIPLVQNLGVMVDDALYYPGDSYTLPETQVELLACPSAAPWMKIGDLMDFLAVVRPKRTFPTHNAILSDFGHTLQNNRIQMVVEENGGSFEYLTPGKTLEI